MLLTKDCSQTDSSVHGIFQARILEWVAIPFCRRSSLPRYKIGLLHCRQILNHPVKPINKGNIIIFVMPFVGPLWKHWSHSLEVMPFQFFYTIICLFATTLLLGQGLTKTQIRFRAWLALSPSEYYMYIKKLAIFLATALWYS